MAFGDTGILDDFNRADEGPPPSASWGGTVKAANGMSVITNVVGLAAGSGFGDAYWTADFGPDSEVFATASTMVGQWNESNMFIATANQGASVDGYELRILRSGNDDLILNRLDNGTRTALGATVTVGAYPTFADGHKFGIETTGDDLKIWYDNGGGWVLQATRTDSTYRTGDIGIGGENAAFRWDDFGGGTVASAVAGGLLRLGVAG